MSNTTHKNMYSRVLSGITVMALIMVMSVSGAFGGFWRTLDGMTSSGVLNPMQYLFGYGVDENSTFGYGYGYGYGENSIDDGENGYDADGTPNGTGDTTITPIVINPGTSSSSGGSGGGGGGGGGGGSTSGGFTSGSSSSSSSGNGTTTSSSSSTSGGGSIDNDTYLQQLQEIKDQLDAAEEANQTPTSGLQLPSILPQTGTSAAAKGIKTFTSPSVETAFPSWLQPASLATAPTDATYWINTIPYAEDRNANSYVVVPTSGIVAPINAATAAEAAKAISGGKFDYGSPLQGGAAHYPGTQKPGENGTAVIFGHSSDYKASAGRYKTIFGKIIELDAGEEIWVYSKNIDGGYDRMRFVVEISKEVTPTNTDILLPKAGKNLTLFTCTPIGGISGRWYVNAKLVGEDAATLAYPNIGSKYVVKINSAMFALEQKLNVMTIERKRSILALIAYRIELAEAKNSDEPKALELLQYIKMKLAEML